MLILISDSFDSGLADRLARYGEVTDDKARLAEAHIVLIRSKTKVTRDYIDSAPNLKMVIRGGVGLDNVDLPYAKEKEIIVQNTADASSIAVAELALTLILAVTNHVGPADRSMHEGKWLKKEFKRTELYGKILGLVGFGRIAREVAIRAKAFGMQILAYDPFVSDSDLAKLIPTLEELVTQSDYLSLHLPLTEETEGIINRGLLARFKDGAYLINTGRGRCVVEEDVAEALASGKLAGYGNDVWYSDPPVDSPLMKAPNVLMMPHLGASTNENLLRISDIIDCQIDEYLKSEAAKSGGQQDGTGKEQ